MRCAEMKPAMSVESLWARSTASTDSSHVRASWSSAGACQLTMVWATYLLTAGGTMAREECQKARWSAREGRERMGSGGEGMVNGVEGEVWALPHETDDGRHVERSMLRPLLEPIGIELVGEVGEGLGRVRHEGTHRLLHLGEH